MVVVMAGLEARTTTNRTKQVAMASVGGGREQEGEVVGLP